MLDREKVYEVKHRYLGTFIGRATEPAYGWCGFVIVEVSQKLAEEEYEPGDYIELTADFYKARPL